MSTLTVKIVVDTNIYISAIFWAGKPRGVIDLGREGHIFIFTSLEIEKEIAEKLETKFKLEEDEISQILLDFSSFAIPVKVNNRVQAILDDPDDDKFIECALACNADYIVSGDSHLLKIKEYAGIKVLNASEFLSVISKQF